MSTVVYPYEKLEALSTEAFTRFGFSREDAAQITDGKDVIVALVTGSYKAILVAIAVMYAISFVLVYTIYKKKDELPWEEKTV